ncbi:MAG: pilus assembly protein [Comamonadaceae bacterium]|nr:MAG: pilus assembly protein [Comamonadaceae bacterium]
MTPVCASGHWRGPAPGRAGQRGIALLIVVILVLVSALLALWGFRSSLLNEAVVGNDADYLRAFEAAQALLQDAEQDINGTRADGRPCEPTDQDAKACRAGNDLTAFIDEEQLLTGLINTLGAESTRCRHGICSKRTGAQDFWSDSTTMAAMTASGVGARYGEYTGAAHGAGSDPILANRAAGEGGWYWVEIMLYDKESPGGALITNAVQNKLVLNLRPSFAYRITAIARGLKPGTQVVLQSTYVRQSAAD